VISYHLRAIGGYQKVSNMFVVRVDNQVLRSKGETRQNLMGVLDHSGSVYVD